MTLIRSNNFLTLSDVKSVTLPQLVLVKTCLVTFFLPFGKLVKQSLMPVKKSPGFSCPAAYDYFKKLLTDHNVSSLRLHGFQLCLMPLFHLLCTHLPTRKLTKQFKKLKVNHPLFHLTSYQSLFLKSVSSSELISPGY